MPRGAGAGGHAPPTLPYRRCGTTRGAPARARAGGAPQRPGTPSPPARTTWRPPGGPPRRWGGGKGGGAEHGGVHRMGRQTKMLFFCVLFEVLFVLCCICGPFVCLAFGNRCAVLAVHLNFCFCRRGWVGPDTHTTGHPPVTRRGPLGVNGTQGTHTTLPPAVVQMHCESVALMVGVCWGRGWPRATAAMTWRRRRRSTRRTRTQKVPLPLPVRLGSELCLPPSPVLPIWHPPPHWLIGTFE